MHYWRICNGKPLNDPIQLSPGTFEVCQITWCDQLHFSKGLCKKHKAILRNKIQACTNPDDPDFKKYGARGIKCTSFLGAKGPQYFIGIMNHLGPPPTDQHSLDRRNNNGNYIKSNLRWATKKEQRANRRVSCNQLKVKDLRTGKVYKSACEAARKTGYNETTVRRHAYNKVKFPRFKLVKRGR